MNFEAFGARKLISVAVQVTYIESLLVFPKKFHGANV